MNINSSLPPVLQAKFERLERRIRTARFVRNLAAGVLILTGLFIAVFLFEAVVGWRVTGLRGANVGFIAVVAAVGATLVFSWSRPLPWTRLAALVERRFPELDERLISTVELPSGADHGSSEWVHWLRDDTVERATPLDFQQAFPLRTIWKLSAVTLALLLITLVPLVSSDGYARFARRLLWAWSPAIYGYALEVTPGDQHVARGRAAAITVHLVATEEGTRLPTACVLVFDEGNATPQRVRMEPLDANHFTHTWPMMGESLTYHIETDELSSDTFRLEVVDPVALLPGQPSATVTPPPYVSAKVMPVTEHAGHVPFTALQYSRLRFTFAFDRPAQRATLRWRSGETQQQAELPLAEDRRHGSWDTLAQHVGPCAATLTLEAEHGIVSTYPMPTWSVWADDPPSFRAAPTFGSSSNSDRPNPLGLGDVLALKTVAEDDVGLDRLELEYRINDGPVRTSLLAEAHGQLRIARDLAWPLPTDLKVGDLLRCRLRLADNRRIAAELRPGIPDREVVANVVYHPSREGKDDRWWSFKVEPRTDALAKALDELAHQENVLAKKAEALAASPEPDQAELEELREAQAKLAARLQELSEKNPRLQPAARRNSQAQARMLAKQAQSLATNQRKLSEADEAKWRADMKAKFADLAKRQGDLAGSVGKLDRDLGTRPASAGLTAPHRPAQEAADRLRDGQVESALAQQQAAEDALKSLSDQLDKSLVLGRDPRSAVDKLARLQDELIKRLEKLGEDYARIPPEETKARLAELAQNQKMLHDAIGKVDLSKAMAASRQHVQETTGEAADLLQRKDALAAFFKMEQARDALQAWARSLPQTAPPLPAGKATPEELVIKKQAGQANELAKLQHELREAVRKLLGDVGSGQGASPAMAAQKADVDNLAKQLLEMSQKAGPDAKAGVGAAAHAALAQKAMAKSQDEKKQGRMDQAKQSDAESAMQLDMASKTLEAAAQAMSAAAPADAKDSPGDVALQKAFADSQMKVDQARQQLPQQPKNAAASMQQAALAMQKSAQQAQGNTSAPGPAGEGDDPAQTDTAAGASLPPGMLPDLKALAGKTWGELPGELRTRIVQDLRARYGDEYGPIIQRYFQQIADVPAAKKSK